MMWIAIAAIVVANGYFALERKKIETDRRSSGSTKLLQQQIEELYQENEALRDRLLRIEDSVLAKKDYIDLDDDKERARLDRPGRTFEY